MTPEVKSDFVSEETILRASGATDAEIDEHKAENNAKQKAFVANRKKKGHLAWAPRKRHRKQAFMYLVALNHQLKQTQAKVCCTSSLTKTENGSIGHSGQ